MRIIITILLLFCLNAEGQVIRANAYYRPFAQVQLLLDLYPNAAAAYSLRKLRTAYTGAAIRVRKDTTGQPEQDISFDANGNLDTVALKSFINARSAYIVRWYDQSGNGRNATQAAQAGQPRIANLGVIDRESGDISLVFDGSNDNLVAASTSALTISPTSFYSVSSRRNTSNSLRTVFSTGILAGVDGYGIFYADLSNFNQQDKITIQTRYGAVVNSPGYYINTINSNNLLFGITKTTGNNLWYNGSETSATFTATNTNTSNNIFIGSNGNPSFYHNGSIQEVTIWQLDQSSSRTGIQSNINSFYGIY